MSDFDSPDPHGGGGSEVAGGESRDRVSKGEVCFIHSARLLETAGNNPRYTGRVRVGSPY